MIDLSDQNSINRLNLFEDFSIYPHDELANAQTLENEPIHLPKFISGLFHQDFITINPDNTNSRIYLEPVVDDRMFVICWYGCNENYWKTNLDLPSKGERSINYKKFSVNKAKSGGPILSIEQEDNDRWYLDSEFWYKFLAVDVSFKTCQNQKMSDAILRL